MIRLLPSRPLPGARAFAALVAATTLAACAPSAPGDRGDTTAGAPLTNTQPMSTTADRPDSGARDPGDAAERLRAVADALAAADAAPDAVLRAVGARDVTRERARYVEFVPDAPGFARGTLKLTREGPAGTPPMSLTLEGVSGDGMPLATLRAAFGAWRRDVPSVDGHEPYVVRFEDYAPGARAGAGGRPPVTIALSAALTADPDSPAARVTRLLLRRDAE